MPPMQVLHAMKSSLEAYEEASATLGTTRGPPGNGRVRWKKPPLRVLKINWDVALLKETQKMGVGVVIRNDI